MKKYLILPAIIGLVAVPSLALAQHDSSTKPVVINQGTSSTLAKPMLADTDDEKAAVATANTATSTTQSTETKPPITVPEGSLTADQAKAVAVGLYPDKTVKKVETEMEHGVLVYEVKFTDGTEVTILASDGSIVKNETKPHAPNANANVHSTSKHNNGHHFGESNDKD